MALALLSQHKEGLLACDSFEQVMNYLKIKLPQIDKPMMDKILKEVSGFTISLWHFIQLQNHLYLNSLCFCPQISYH